jgi:hypothetical protein
MNESPGWIIVIPLLAMLAPLALYKVYLLYAGRSTRGNHTNFAPTTSVDSLEIRLRDDWAREDRLRVSAAG